MEVFAISSPPPDAARGFCHRDPHASGRYLLTARGREYAQSSPALPRAFRDSVRRASPHHVTAEERQRAVDRLVRGMASRFADPLPEPVIDEIVLALHADPALRLEYVGRGTSLRMREPGEAALLRSFDVPGGRRRYLLRPVAADEATPDISPRFRAILADFGVWLTEPGARLVVSVGGGGYRMFAVTPTLKLIDMLLGDRARIAEVWGCSGGAVAGHAYAEGLNPDVLDELGYTIYHRRNPSLPDFSVASVGKLWLSALVKRSAEQDNPIQRHWIDTLHRLQARFGPPSARIPFYAVSSNPGRRGLFALTDPEHLSPLCSDFILAADRAKALAASAAVPVLFPTQRGIQDDADDVWLDGGLIDENPLVLPFVKWARERDADPDGTPDRLKIVLFDLNARAAESQIITRLSGLPWIGRFGVKRFARQLDMLLDSRTQLTLTMIAQIPRVEVYRIKLSLGAFAVRDRGNILRAISGGRRNESWQLSLIGKGR